MRKLPAVLLLGALVATPASLRAQDRNPFDSDDASDLPDEGEEPARDESTPLYVKAMELHRKGKWKEAAKLLLQMIEKYPESVHKDDAEFRAGDNFYAGCTKIHESGPPGRRIDVAVMGDGFQIKPEAQEEQ